MLINHLGKVFPLYFFTNDEQHSLCEHVLFVKQHIDYFTQKTSHYPFEIFTEIFIETEKKQTKFEGKKTFFGSDHANE